MDFAECDEELQGTRWVSSAWRGSYVPREAFDGISATPLARVEAQDVSGRRVKEKNIR